MSESPSSQRGTEHPTAEELAAYLSSGMAAADRAALESHLAGCRACRREVSSAHQLVRARPRPARWVMSATAAAVLAFALLRPWAPSVGRIGSPAEGVARDGRSDSANVRGILPLAPTDGDTIAAAAVVFAWQAHRGDVLYRLSLTDGRGRAVFSIDTHDTTVTLPATVVLTPGNRYFWYVDALGADAASSTTGTRAFVVAP